MASTSSALLLLPPTPKPISPASFSAAYSPAISAAVSSLKISHTSSQLQVLLPYSRYHGRLHLPRSGLYEETQKLLAVFYSLLSSVCAKLGVEVDSDLPSSVDARVILLDYEDSQSFNEPGTPDRSTAGPIVDLATFAASRCQWRTIFSVESEEGHRLLARYTGLANRTGSSLLGQVQLVPGGLIAMQKTVTAADPQETSVTEASKTSHDVVAVGGTFDHLHAGHKLLLTATSFLLQPASSRRPSIRRLIIGITGDELLKNKKFAEYMKSWEQRQQDVVDFLMSIMPFTRATEEQETRTRIFDEPGPNGYAVHTTLVSSSIIIECVKIQDPFGPTITDESVTALVVSGETRSGAQAVNEKRADKGWQALEVFEVDVLDAIAKEDTSSSTAEDFASKISSTEIRKRRAEMSRTSSL